MPVGIPAAHVGAGRAAPMAVGSGKDTFSQCEIAFKCPKCGSEETGQLRRAALSPVAAPG